MVFLSNSPHTDSNPKSDAVVFSVRISRFGASVHWELYYRIAIRARALEVISFNSPLTTGRAVLHPCTRYFLSMNMSSFSSSPGDSTISPGPCDSATLKIHHNAERRGRPWGGAEFYLVPLGIGTFLYYRFLPNLLPGAIWVRTLDKSSPVFQASNSRGRVCCSQHLLDSQTGVFQHDATRRVGSLCAGRPLVCSFALALGPYIRSATRNEY